MDATEDAAARRVIAFQKPEDIAGQGTTPALGEARRLQLAVLELLRLVVQEARLQVLLVAGHRTEPGLLGLAAVEDDTRNAG